MSASPMTVRELIERLQLLAAGTAEVLVLTDDDTHRLTDVVLGTNAKRAYLLIDDVTL